MAYKYIFHNSWMFETFVIPISESTYPDVRATLYQAAALSIFIIIYYYYWHWVVFHKTTLIIRTRIVIAAQEQ